VGVERGELAVFQTPAAGGPEDDPFTAQRGAGMTHAEIDEQRSVARGSRAEREALLETGRGVQVPLRQLRAQDLDPRSVARHLSRVHRGERCAAADARQAQREQLRAPRRRPVHDADPRLLEVGAKVLGPVRRLQAQGVGARLVFPLREVALHARHPALARGHRRRCRFPPRHAAAAVPQPFRSFGADRRREQEQREKREQPSNGGRRSHRTFSSNESAHPFGGVVRPRGLARGAAT
jgi:hypothetical protein